MTAVQTKENNRAHTNKQTVRTL